jgi:hypothetical protein
MDFNQLMARMREIDSAPAQQESSSAECGNMMSPPPMQSPMSPQQPPIPHPSLSVNLNAQGMDNIEQIMKLITKVNPDAVPKDPLPAALTAMPGVASMAPGMSTGMPPLKMLPDFDADNNDKVGGEMDIEIEPMDKDAMSKMDLDNDDDEGSQPGELAGSLDRDGDGDHDMDDHDMEPDDDEDKKEAWANEPDEQVKDIDYMVNKLAGGMNRSQETYPKVAGGDNPMQRVKQMGEDDLRMQIRAELQRRLAESKGVK